MKPKKTYLSFDIGPRSPSGKTGSWYVRACGVTLGTVFWYSPWRRYVFAQTARAGEVIFEQECLRDIAEFIEAYTDLHRTERAKKK